VLLDMGDERPGRVGIERLHLEQDAGKSIHDQHPTMSYVDLNRSGVALMEIVSKPDMRSSDEAKAYVTKLRTILRYLGTCDGNMDEGSMRADVNVSVRKPGGEFGTRCEIKNVNSIRFIGQAIEYEARRQIDISRMAADRPGNPAVRPEEGRDPLDALQGRSARLPLFPRSRPAAAGIRRRLTSMNWPRTCRNCRTRRRRVCEADSALRLRRLVLCRRRRSADYFEKVAKGRDGKMAANWVINELFGRLNKEGKDIADSPVSAGQLGGSST
jgi:aspartyl-tRNA(Asn)/glutamyl-tRNA(Gln) amidotransferase subunit B